MSKLVSFLGNAKHITQAKFLHPDHDVFPLHKTDIAHLAEQTENNLVHQGGIVGSLHLAKGLVGKLDPLLQTVKQNLAPEQKQKLMEVEQHLKDVQDKLATLAQTAPIPIVQEAASFMDTAVKGLDPSPQQEDQGAPESGDGEMAPQEDDYDQEASDDPSESGEEEPMSDSDASK